MVDHTNDIQQSFALPGRLFRRGDSVLRTRRFNWIPRRRFLAVSLGFMALLALVSAGVYIRLMQGPIAIGSFKPRLAGALEERFGKGWRFYLGEASLERGRHGATLAVDGLNIQANGRTVVAAPRAEVSLDALDLLLLQVRPRRLMSSTSRSSSPSVRTARLPSPPGRTRAKPLPSRRRWRLAFRPVHARGWRPPRNRRS